MDKIAKKYTRKIKFNFKPGITVGLVSIPLSISLAIASGVSPIIGIISAFWGGAIAALFAGSAYNIIGPTGALSGLILSYVLTQGIATLPSLTICVGVLILIAALLNFQKYLIYIPGAVIHGFTLGVAFTIGLGQLNNAFALKPAATHAHLLLNIIESLKALGTAELASVVLFIFGLSFLLFVKKRFKSIPGPILLSVVGILFGYLSTNHIIALSIPTLFSKFGQMHIQLLPQHFPQLAITRHILQSASVIALIGIIETMLSAKVACVMTKTKFDERREMFALSLANIVSGFAGGLPVTAALARTSLNIKSGADSNVSAVISAVIVGIIASLFFGLFQYLPLAIVAAILINVAINMVEKEHFMFLLKNDSVSFIISIIVGFITVAADPILAVGIGSIIMLLRQIQRISEGDYEILLTQDRKLTGNITQDEIQTIEEGGDPVVYSFNSDLTYINKESHILRLEEISKHTKSVILRFRTVSYIDPDGLLMLEEIVEYFEKQHIAVYFTGVSDKIQRQFEQTSFFRSYHGEGLIFSKTSAALAKIRS